MVSSQKPNQNQLAVAKQFVDLFPSVKLSLVFIRKKTGLVLLDYCTIWNSFSIKSNNE